MTELTQEEGNAVLMWKNLGYDTMELSTRVLAKRHREEHRRIFEAIKEI